MKTQDDTWKVHAFVDGELDLASQLAMEERLKEDAVLRRQVDEVRELREWVREKADRHVAPADLRAHLAARIEAAPGQPQPRSPASVRPSALAQTLQRWLAWRPLVAAMSLAIVATAGLNVLGLRSSGDERLVDDVVASHVRSTLGQHLVDVASSDHHTVKPFLSARLGFSPPVEELQIPGSSFLGGRVDYLDGRPVAALVYKQGEHVVNSFIWPGPAADSKPAFATERGFRSAHWSAHGMTHWVISDVNRDEFQAIVAAVQRTDSRP